MTPFEANKRIKHLAKECFGMDFNLPIEINGRLTKSLGQYKFFNNKRTGKITPSRLELAARLLTNYSDETIESVIKHELCHWALSVQGRPFDDGDPEFESELRRVGAHSTGIIKIAGEVHQMKCKGCHKTLIRANSKGRLNKYIENRRGYTSKCCKAGLYYAGAIQVEDTNKAPAAQVPIAKIPEQPRKIPIDMPQSSPRAVAVKTANTNDLSIDMVLEKGPRGVTNKQMIPAIQKSIDMGESKARILLKMLKEAYPFVYQGTLRYIGKSYQVKLEAMMG